MTRLSVNVNKIATLRNARGGNLPDVLQVSKDLLDMGAQGLTVHPRPDGRHIREADVAALQAVIQAAREKGSDVEFNIEGYPDARFLGLLRQYPPQQVTLVPDSPTVLTSHAGWDVAAKHDLLRDVLAQWHGQGIRTSLFVEADRAAVEAAHAAGAQCIELYTGPYAAAQGEAARQAALQPYIAAAHRAQALGLRIHAGHDLSLENIGPFVQAIPFVHEVSIGHALICESLYYGLQNVVGMYLERISRASRDR